MQAYVGRFPWSHGLIQVAGVWDETPGAMGSKPPLLATDAPEITCLEDNFTAGHWQDLFFPHYWFVFQLVLAGSPWGEWALYTNSPSPLRALYGDLSL